MQHEDYIVDLQTPGVEEKQTTLVAPVEDKPVTESIVEMVVQPEAETTQEGEIPAEFVQPSVEEVAPTLVAPTEEKATVELTEEFVGEAGEATCEEEIRVELAETSVESRRESRVCSASFYLFELLHIIIYIYFRPIHSAVLRLTITVNLVK